MAAHASELRSRLLEVTGGAIERKKSSHVLVTIKAPPNSAREESSRESVQSEPSLRPTPVTALPLMRNKLKNAESELRFIEGWKESDHLGEDTERPSLNQRIGALLRKSSHTDVVFRVGKGDGTPVEAHRLILASASRVFEQLLYSDAFPLPTTPEGKRILREPESSLVPFQVFLTGIYTNGIPLSLSLSMALEVLYAAKKYEVVFLQGLVIEHVVTAVTTVNVLEALSISTKLMELTSIIPACWKIIEEETRTVLEHHLEVIEAHELGRILERDVLNMTEIEIFQYLVRWAVVQCKRRGLKWTGRRKRQMMEPLLKHVRFTTMDAETIRDFIGPARVLDPREISAIMTHICGPEHLKVPLPYKTTPRRIPVSKQVHFVNNGSIPSLDGLLSELILDYGTDTEVQPCAHKKKFKKHYYQKPKLVKRHPLSQR